MITTCKSAFFACEDLGISVQTNDQSIKKQPCLWLIHSSAGISSNEDLWAKKALEKNYTVIMVDSFTNRGIFKQNWSNNLDKKIDPKIRAQDQIKAFNHLVINQAVIKFADLTNSKIIGFSDGGTSGIWLQHNKWPGVFSKSYCLYPATHPELVPDTLYEIKSNKVHIFVGDLDTVCPKEYNQDFQKKTNCQLTIWPNVYHGYSKPDKSQLHADTSKIYSEYNKAATEATMKVVFDEME